MEPDRLDDLERRVAALEAELEAWRSRTRELIERRYGGAGRGTVSPSATARGHRPVRSPWHAFVDAVTGEGAIGRIGIGLLLLGLVYAVQYGIDRGWITELVQVVLAAVLGFVLLGFGQRIRTSHPVLARLLTGGGFGALYVSVFAAEAVYGLMPFGPALVLMSLVTAGCFLLGTSRDDAAMGVVAVLGGLATPFIMEAGDTSLPALVAYVAVVLAAAGLLYWRHGWRSLLLAASMAALPVLGIVLTFLQEPDVAPRSWPWSVQLGLLMGVVVFSVIPLARSSFPGLRPVPSAPDWIGPAVPRMLGPAIAVAAALAAWGASRIVWDLDPLVWAGVGVPLTGLAALGHLGLARGERRDEAAAALVITALLAGVVFVDLFEGGGLSVAGWSLVLLALMESARRQGRHGAREAAGILALVLVFWLPARLGEGPGDHLPFLSWDGVGDALGLAFLAVAARGIAGRQGRIVAGFALWVVALALMGREFTHAGALSAAWSVFAIVLLAGGRYGRTIRLAGMATVALVVAKLLLFDLSRLDGLVRVGLFAGFGAALLVVSYLFPSWWRGASGGGEGAGDARTGAEP